MASSPRKVRSKSIGHYVLLKTIGEGTFGKVKLGKHILTGERVAVKVLEKERFVDAADVARVAREIHILKLIRHSHIIQLYEIIETPRQLYLIMEFASGGELFDYIVQHGRAEEKEACRFLHQILAGVEKVHGMGVVHRDLKPENLLLDDHKDIKIVDFGLSNTYQTDQLLQTACGSPCYAAPEMIAGHKYVPSMVDIWSCGVILFALVCGYLPFESTETDQNHAELFKKILEADYEMPNFVSPEVADLISGMLTTDPQKRLTLDQIRQHPWYRQIPEASVPDYEDKGILDEEILEQLDCYGFPRDYTVKCLKSNKHNHATTTYFLLKEKKHSAKVHGATDRAIADLEATGHEETHLAAAVAAVATPSRGHRAEGSDYPQRRRPGSAPGSTRGGNSREATATTTLPAGATRSTHGDGSQTARGPSGRGDVVQCGPPDPVTGEVPVEFPIGLSRGIPDPITGDAQLVPRGWGSSDPIGGSGVPSARDGSIPSPQATLPSNAAPCYSMRHSNVAVDADGIPLVARSHRRQHDAPGGARSASPAPRSVASPSGCTTPRSRPMSARGSGVANGYGRRPSAERGARQYQPRRGSSPFAGAGYYQSAFDAFDDFGGSTAFGSDPLGPYARAAMDYYSGVPSFARDPLGAVPLTARPRLQGNQAPYRDRLFGTQPPVGPPDAWGVGPVRAVVPPVSARGPRGTRNGDAAPREDDACHMSCSSSLPPATIIYETLRALTNENIAYRQISSFRIRCQASNVRFEAEVLQHSRGGKHMLRFSRAAGATWRYKEICEQLFDKLQL